MYGLYMYIVGWFNSLAGVVKRRFASYVKLHLAQGTGEGTSTSGSGANRERPRGAIRTISINGVEMAKPHLRSVSANAAVSHFGYNSAVKPAGSSAGGADGSGVISKIQAPSPHVLVGGNDRRHRSPDPPPR